MNHPKNMKNSNGYCPTQEKEHLTNGRVSKSSEIEENGYKSNQISKIHNTN